MKYMFVIAILILFWNTPYTPYKKVALKNLYDDVLRATKDTTKIVFTKKFIACCKKSLFSQICSGWEEKCFYKADRDCLQECFIICNNLCSDLFYSSHKTVEFHLLCTNCKKL